jgi:tetratricopeptide (TPR) repeat protein
MQTSIMRHTLALLTFFCLTVSGCTSSKPTTSQIQTPSETQAPESTAPIRAVPTPAVQIKQPTQTEIIQLKKHMFQTFNNCGPATYSMVLSYLGIDEPQSVLGDELRPYQNAKGDNDDKSVTLTEIAEHSKKFKLIPYYRPNGTTDKLKLFISNGMPVVLRTWLNDHDDIGHFIIVRGYDDSTQMLTFDDSYYGKNRQVSYSKMNSLWQPFNYEYMVLTNQENQKIAETILKEEVDSKIAWQNAIERNQNDQKTSENPYPSFNLAVAYYEIGDYTKSIQIFEQVQPRLPRRMLWYQLQPIHSYQKLNQHQKVFELTDAILNNQNRAYSELYLIRANSYLVQGNKEKAKSEAELAIKYNIFYTPAKDFLNML